MLDNNNFTRKIVHYEQRGKSNIAYPSPCLVLLLLLSVISSLLLLLNFFCLQDQRTLIQPN